EYYEISASNLKINSDYTSIFTTKVVALGRATSNKDLEWKHKANSLIKNLNVSAETLEASEMRSHDGNMVCWQQPGLADIHGNHLISYPLLAANFCDNSWCGEFYWTGSNSIQFWAQIHPRKYQLILLDTKSGTYEFKKQVPVSKRKTFPQLNAPRENLVTEKNISGHLIPLSSIQGNNIRISWNKLKNNKIRVSLSRNKFDAKTAINTTPKISKKIDQKEIPQALQLIKFALWLDPGNINIKTERLRAYWSLLLFDNLFESLKEDFTKEERFSACQKLHVETSLRTDMFRIRFQKQFDKNFDKICNTLLKTDAI
ncbi:hypothetical protein KKA14_20360, partial [bacterium]|nr:hypothetical protein [bacterium]